MHVCHLAKYYPPAAGGIETHVQTLARGQQAAGERVTVVCINHRNADGMELWQRGFAATPATEDEDEGIRILRAPRRFSLSKWDYSPGLPRLIHKLQDAPRPIDLFHLHAPNPTMVLAYLAAGTNVPLIVTHHSDIIKQRMLGRIFMAVEQRLFHRAKLILTDSPPYADGSKQLQRFRDKVQALPLGIELEPFLRPSPAAVAFRDRLRREYPGPLWLSVGRLVYYKGLHVALRALQTLPGNLVIIGEGPLRRELETQARELGVGDRVVWLGKASADELVGAYHAAAALLFPSNARSEGFGLVQVEAMAAGCPVVNTAIPYSGVAWVSVHEESGLTVAMNSPEELAAAARRLLDEPELRPRLAATAIERAQRLFDARQMVQRSLDFYRGVLHGVPLQAIANRDDRSVREPLPAK